MHMTWNIQKYRTVHCMIWCVNVNIKYHHPMHLKLPWIHGLSNFHIRRADVSQIPFFVWILYYFNGKAEVQLEVAILSYLTKFGGFLPSRNRDNGKQFLGGETFPSVNPSRQISRKPAAVFPFAHQDVLLNLWYDQKKLNSTLRSVMHLAMFNCFVSFSFAKLEFSQVHKMRERPI